MAYKNTLENKELIRRIDREFYHKNKERILARKKRYYLLKKEEILVKRKLEYQIKTDVVKERVKRYRKNNKSVVRALSAKSRVARKQRIPKWANLKAIKEFYKNCPPGMTVDHIIPLQGKNICGLHVLENLQYLTRSENSRKGNRF